MFWQSCGPVLLIWNPITGVIGSYLKFVKLSNSNRSPFCQHLNFLWKLQEKCAKQKIHRLDNILDALDSELVSKELNHFGVIAGLFRQIGGHRSRFVLFCPFWRLFTIKMIKSVKVFPFSFWKIITIFFYFIKFNPPA